MELHYPAAEELELVEVLHALSDPVRLELVQVLDRADGALACVDLPLPVSKSTASHHYKVLREAGVVRCREEGTRRYYTLRRDDLEARFPGLLATVLRAAADRPMSPKDGRRLP
jgi:DNA-binding transcriptional ArsR family regulator